MVLPAYLQGTQTGGLLGALEQQQQSQQAQFPAGQQYVPGQGMPPYAATQQPGITAGGGTGMAGSTFSGYDPSDLYVGGRLYTGPTAALMRQQGVTGDNDDMTVIGQQTPDEIARNEAIMNAGIDRSTTGGGGGAVDPSAGAAGAGAGEAAGQLASLFGQGGESPTPSFGQPSYPGGGGLGYQAPGGQPGLPPVGQPGGGFQPPPSGQFQPPQGGALMMEQMSPQQALSQYYQTPGYQLMFGQDAAQRFQQDPGYQFAMDQAMDQVARNASARGLLGSGRMLKDLQDRAQGMAAQQYGDWFNRQRGAFTDYQNRLAGLAGGPTGAEQAMQTGTNLGQTGLQTGANLASLMGGQASAGMGGIIGTGAARAGNITQAGNIQAQIDAANQATRLGGASIGQGLF